MTDNPARLLDAKAIQREYGFPQQTAYRLMDRLPNVDLKPEGIRKRLVWREDFERMLEERTVRV